MSVNLPLVLLGFVLADTTAAHWSLRKTGADSKLRGVHALDPEGVRLFDTLEKGLTVTGEAREFGFIRMEHAWRDCETTHGSR